MAKLAGTELPKTSRTFLMAEAESTPKDEIDKFLENLGAAVEVCASNLDGQKTHIDAWRDVAKSGLLTLPTE
jgi:hypothetical protein